MELDLQSLVDGVAPTNANRSEYLLDNIDLPKVINYMATMQVLGDVDYSEKNFFLEDKTIFFIQVFSYDPV